MGTVAGFVGAGGGARGASRSRTAPRVAPQRREIAHVAARRKMPAVCLARTVGEEGTTAAKVEAPSGKEFAPWALEPDEVLENLKVDARNGLSSDEVQKRREQYGRNVLESQKGKSLLSRILAQFQDNLVIILIIAALVSFVLAFFEDDADKLTAFFEPLVIVLILFINAAVGVLQETNAEKAIAALRSYESESANVIRDGSITSVDSSELVPGDIVVINAGEQVPADARIVKLESSIFMTDQSILTGESEPVAKGPIAVEASSVVQEKTCMIFSGTTAVAGRCIAVVTSTASKTELGSIQSSLSELDEIDTPLQQKLEEFGDFLSKMILGICVVVWIISIGKFEEHGGFLRGAVYYFKTAVALAVAAVPEGLPAVVTTTLSLGASRMAKKNAFVKKLPAVETLGCTSVICSDKTGTLTTNRMSVRKALAPVEREDTNKIGLAEWDIQGTTFDVDGEITSGGSDSDLARDNPDILKEMSAIATICNDASIKRNEENNVIEGVGAATELALVVFAEKVGQMQQKKGVEGNGTVVDEVRRKWSDRYKRLKTLEFTRDRKAMSVVLEDKVSGERRLFIKGAPDGILKRCDKMRVHGGDAKMSEADKKLLFDRIQELAEGSGLRWIGLAVKDAKDDEHKLQNIPKNAREFAEFEEHATFLGAVGMLDPPRQEAKDAIAKCKTAGVRVVMITGDDKVTGETICRQLGMVDEGESLEGRSFTGREFDKLEGKEALAAAEKAVVFSRVEPSHKQKLVRTLQEEKYVVAMTGDGVNDAPALKRADIGLAMGSGTAVARGASAMVLSDDNFATIVAAVEEGRSIFSNMKQVIRYIISSNIGEVVCIFLGSAAGFPDIFKPVQLLWVNLVTDGFPATALSFNPTEPDVMLQKPRDPDTGFINKLTLTRFGVLGGYIGAVTTASFAYYFVASPNGPHLSLDQVTHYTSCATSGTCQAFETNGASTVALTTLVTLEMFNALNSVSETESIFRVSPAQNRWLLPAIGSSMAVHLVVLYVPFFNRVFNVQPLGLMDWLVIIALSAPILFLDEVIKAITRSSR